jgi:hypothetical protein
MKEIRYFMNEYIFVANSILLFCYMQTNLVMFRLLFIAACIFLTIDALSVPIISIDMVLFNMLFTFINIYLVTPLIKNLAPPNFSKEQKEIYENHFRNYLTPMELSKLLFYHRRRIFRVTTPIVKAGNEFSSLFFITNIGKNCTVTLKSKKNKFDLNQYSWLGVPEYLDLISRKETLALALKESSLCEWNITILVNVENPMENLLSDADEGDEIHIDTHLLNNEVKDQDNEVILYEFELSCIEKIFSDPIYGIKIMRGLYSIWLKYCADVVKKVDQAATGITSMMNTTYKKNNPLEDSKIKRPVLPVTHLSMKKPDLKISEKI